jgi:hypothetical protein
VGRSLQQGGIALIGRQQWQVSAGAGKIFPYFPAFFEKWEKMEKSCLAPFLRGPSKWENEKWEKMEKILLGPVSATNRPCDTDFPPSHGPASRGSPWTWFFWVDTGIVPGLLSLVTEAKRRHISELVESGGWAAKASASLSSRIWAVKEGIQYDTLLKGHGATLGFSSLDVRHQKQIG